MRVGRLPLPFHIVGPGGQVRIEQFGVGPGPLGALLLLLFLVVIAAAVALIITLLIRRGHVARRWAGATSGPWRTPATFEALRILNERFAKGEIEPDDYRERRDLLQGQ
ncbi:MAG: hypothetical protein WCA31_04230 [Acidimicrobiales bacterium]